jgi:hypothetical protein
MVWLICPVCKQGSEYEKPKGFEKMECPHCGARNSYYELVNYTNYLQERKKEEALKEVEKPKRRLEVQAKLRFTKTGSVEVRIFLPQNYLRKMFGLPSLPREQLKKAKIEK